MYLDLALLLVGWMRLERNLGGPEGYTCRLHGRPTTRTLAARTSVLEQGEHAVRVESPEADEPDDSIPVKTPAERRCQGRWEAWSGRNQSTVD